MKTQISYSYPIKVWLLTVFVSPCIAEGLSELVIYHRIGTISFDWLFIMALVGAVLSLPALGLIFSLFCYLTPEIRCAKTLRVTIVLFAVVLFLLTCFILGFSARELLDSEVWHFFLAYLGVMVVAGSLVYIESEEGESRQYV